VLDISLRLAVNSFDSINVACVETWNVWTHLGAMLVGMAFVLWASIHSTSFLSTLPLLDRSIFLIYIFSANVRLRRRRTLTPVTRSLSRAPAQILFTCSSTFHLLACIGQKQYTWLARMDYAGISILIGTFHPRALPITLSLTSACLSLGQWDRTAPLCSLRSSASHGLQSPIIRPCVWLV